ncbi:MAG TPA: D-hexose-6-phosphate mutarotase [Tepidisphaeraceae bacterium]|jgi:glucose-6-phosphate 1-epimerase
MTVQECNERFGRGEQIRFEAGRGGLTRAVLSAPAATGEIYLHGAHVTAYQQRGTAGASKTGAAHPLLFVSEKSIFESSKPIRGGVPVLFPWFGPRGGTDRTQMHGFVRTLPWTVSEVSVGAEATSVSLVHEASDETRKIWPHAYRATFTFTVGPTLKMALAVTNTGPAPFTFEEGLHTYFAISDIAQVSVDGLRGHWYRDRTVSEESAFDKEDRITFSRRVDRLYRDARGTAVIRDPGLKREIVVSKENSATTVVWNPHTIAAGEFADLDAAEPQRFVCVESCNARDNAYTLQPGETHTLTTMIGVRAIQ